MAMAFHAKCLRKQALTFHANCLLRTVGNNLHEMSVRFPGKQEKYNKSVAC